ncbi:hypothetical protein HDV04_004060 [Boothiomyces sp. JEL0838]|nr:hypothetical protein HDV04_004060 [Boothiomyces sp. JEL0838]
MGGDSIIRQIFTKPKFNADRDIPSLEGKVALITGASGGIGKACALELAKKGCHVFLFGRSAEKTLPVIEEIKAISKNDKVEFLEADLMDLAQVEQAADKFLEKGLPLHILINNAGIMHQPYKLTKDNMESQLGTNHFAHVVLTNKLLGVIEASAPSRVVNITSILHENPYKHGINYDTWCDEKSYNAEDQYGTSKLLNVHFTKKLQEKLDAKAQAEGKEGKVYVNCVHPGVVKSNLLRNPANYSFFFDLSFKIIGISTEHGAITQLYVATNPSIEAQNIKGKYFTPYHQIEETSAMARDEKLINKSWEWTEAQLIEKFKPDWKWAI